jgi:pimeloyl-ACP methyl ester carboxylesterase
MNESKNALRSPQRRHSLELPRGREPVGISAWPEGRATRKVVNRLPAPTLHALAMFSLLMVIVFGLAAGVATATARPVLSERCLTKAERRSAVSFRTSDHVLLRGVMVGRGKIGIALGHELHADLCNWMPFARVLAHQGYRVLAFDFRGFGSSGRASRSNRSRLDRDMVAAANLLRRRGSDSVVLAGASMGGTAALVAAVATPQVAAVLTLSGPAVFSSLNALTAVARLQTPTLFLAGRDDASFVEDAQALYAASAAADKTLELRPTDAHGTDLLRGADGAAVRALLLAFLRSHTG